MWLLLVAAGSGYLARCYQHVLRDESFRLAEIGQNSLLKTRDRFEFRSLEAAAAAAETQLAVVEPSSESSAHTPPAQFDPISKPSVSSQEEPQILERHPNLDIYPPRDHQSWDAISSAAQSAGEQQDSQYAGGMSEGEATSVAGACSYPDEIHLLHTIRPKRQKLSHRVQDWKAPCMEDSDTVHVAGSAEDVVCRREEVLFRCGVGIGVLLASKSRTSEIQKLQQLLTEAEAQLEDIERGTKRSIQNHVPEPEPISQAAEEVEEPNQNPHVEFSVGIIDEDMMEEETESEEECVQILLRKGASSSSLPVEQMMELEAELEAELEQLTGQFSDDVVDKVRVESDDNDDSASEVPFMNNNYAVSPRELTRLLCKLQETLQEERISKLEADLESVETHLQLKEEELEKWKKHVLCLSELSLTSTPGTLLGPQGAELCMHTGGVFSTPYGKPSPTTETISKSNESGCSSTVPGGQENFQVPLQQPSGSSGFSLLDSFLDAQYGRQEGSTTGSSSKDEHPGVDRRLDFGDALDALRAWNDDEVCDEFLQAMVNGPGAEPAWGEQDRQEASSECKPLFHELKKTDNLFVGVAEYLKPKTSNSGSISPSISEFSDAVSMLEDWASGSDSATGPGSHPARDALQDAREIPDWIMTALYGRPGETTISVSEVSDGKPRETTDMTTLSSSTKYTDPSIIKSVPSCNQNPTTYCWNTDDRLDHVGVNTPINHHPHSRKRPILSTCSKGDLELLECGSGESSPRIADQIIFWDNLVRRGRPPLGILRGDCECQLECSQSQAPDLNYDRQQKQQQQQQQDYQDSPNVESTHCCKESPVVTADHAHKYSSGNLPFTTIAAERRMHISGRKHGSDIFSSETNAMLIAARPRCTTSSKEEEEEEEETHRVHFSVQSGKRVEKVPKKLVSKDGIEAEEEEYKFLQRQLQHLRL